MKTRACIGNQALIYLAKNPGLENRIQYGDLFRALRLWEGTALQQRISEKRAQGYDIRSFEEQRDDGVKIVFYWMPIREAKRVLRLNQKGLLSNPSRSKTTQAVAA